MPDPLSLIPEGSQYDTLRSTLRILQRDFPQDYAGLVNQESRITGWVKEIDRVEAGNAGPNDRDADQIRDDIVQFIIGPEAAQRVYGLNEAQFQQLILGANEGGINLGDQTVVPPSPQPPSPPVDPIIPEPEPPEPEVVEPIDFRQRAQALFPWLPPELLDIYADAWARTGDPNLALAELRASPNYNNFFPGNRRDDGSLRLSEAEYLARIDGFKLALGQFNLNPANFEGRFAEMIVGGLTAGQFASRLSAAFNQIITAMPEIRAAFSDEAGITMTDEAIFAAFLDPGLGDDIINRRISQAQIGGAGAAAGFDIDLAFTEQLRQRGVGLSQAQAFFGDAAFQVPVLSRLAQRFGLDKTFDITEFAAGTILGDPAERRRQRRLFGASTSSFSERLGTVRTEEDLSLSGLTPR